MKKLLSNEFRTSSLSLPWVEAAVNEQAGLGTDPLELLILLEEQEGYDEDSINFEEINNGRN